MVIASDENNFLGNAVQVWNAEKSFVNFASKKPFKVFSGLNITVPVGNVYGLLGPSGCGKTTILRCIVGREKLDSGQIAIFGHPPGSEESGVPGRNVGFMPQETCIFETMTIAECFNYFGTVLGLSPKIIQSRTKYYEKILKLPSVNMVTGNLSGGQGRRVSFAIALIHRPKLIVLDEPTVGIDPIVKIGMWRHMIELANRTKASIILTTHYIEEARQAHLVGLMQDGALVAEDSADNLISHYNCHSLEEVFLQISFSNDETTREINDNDKNATTNDQTERIGAGMKPASANRKTCSTCEEKDPAPKQFLSVQLRDLRIRWRSLKSNIIKHLLFLFRFPGGLIFLTCLPAGIVLIFHFTFDGEIGHLNVNVVNHDEGDFGRRYLLSLEPHVLEQTPYTSLSNARLDLRDGKSYAVINIGQNFSEMLKKRIDDGVFANEDTLQSSKINLFVDNMNFHIGMLVTYHSFTRLQDFMRTITNSSIGESPIVFNKGLYDYLEKPSLKAVILNTILTAAYYAAAAGTVMMLFVERTKGYLERTFVAGSTVAETLFGLMIVELLLVGAQTVIQMSVVLAVYRGLTLGASILLFFFLYFTGACGTSYGLLVSLVFSEIHSIILVAATSVIISGATTAAFWPIEAMPYFFQYICLSTPLLYPSKALYLIMNNRWHTFYNTISMGFIILFIWFMLCILISFKFLHFLK